MVLVGLKLHDDNVQINSIKISIYENSNTKYKLISPLSCKPNATYTVEHIHITMAVL